MSITIDRTDITIDRTDITIDQTSAITPGNAVSTLSRPALKSLSAATVYVAGYAAPFGGDPIGAAGFLDPDTGSRVILVAVDEPRADGGQGRVFAVQPGYVPQEVPLNGHDIYSTARFIQAFNGMMLLRPLPGRWYFRGDEIAANAIALHVQPSFPSGTRVIFNATAAPLGSLIAGNNYFARVSASSVTLHATRSNALTGANPFTLNAGSSDNRYYLERNDPYEVLDNPDRNLGTPLLLQPFPNQREALAAGFDRIEIDIAAESADATLDALLVPNHRLVDGDAVSVTASTIPGLVDGAYYAGVLNPHQIRLFGEQLEALAGAGDSLADITDTGTAHLRKVGSEAAPIPPAREGVYFANRAWLVYGRDMLLASGVMDPLHYRRISDEYRINVGSDDAITAVAPFNEDTLVVFKQRSILALTGVYGDLSQMRLIELTREFGCLAPLSIASTGSDLVFLSQRGVVTLKQTAEGLTQSVVEPLSDHIQPYIDQIDARSEAQACAAYHDNRYLLAVGRVSGGTMVLVHNFLNRAWEGVWEGSMLDPAAFVHVSDNGRRILAWIDRSRFVQYFGKGMNDQAMDGTQAPIQTAVLSRGYGFDQLGHKRWTLSEFEVATSGGEYSLFAQLDGVLERVAMRQHQTHDRTRYLTYGAGQYDLTNIADAFLDPHRADYTLTPEFMCKSGVKTGVHQRYLLRNRMSRRNGSAVQFELSTASGSVEILSTLAEGIPHGTYGQTQH